MNRREKDRLARQGVFEGFKIRYMNAARILDPDGKEINTITYDKLSWVGIKTVTKGVIGYCPTMTDYGKMRLKEFAALVGRLEDDVQRARLIEERSITIKEFKNYTGLQLVNLLIRLSTLGHPVTKIVLLSEMVTNTSIAKIVEIETNDILHTITLFITGLMPDDGFKDSSLTLDMRYMKDFVLFTHILNYYKTEKKLMVGSPTSNQEIERIYKEALARKYDPIF